MRHAGHLAGILPLHFRRRQGVESGNAATTSSMTRAPDAEAVDSAIVALVRSSDLAGTMEPIWRYAVRDQWYIGHKAVFAAQSSRTLQSIGWQHAEPVLRSLVGIAGSSKQRSARRGRAVRGKP
jgi:hypothetical protein